MKKIVVILVIFSLILLSCDNFLSKSWGKYRDYDPDNINVTLSNIDDWVRVSVGNTELSKALAEAILRKMASSSPEEQAEFLNAGIKVSMEASGIGTALLTKGADLLEDMDNMNEDQMTELLRKVQADFLTSGGVKVADQLAKMALLCIQKGNPPHFNKAFSRAAQPSTVAEAIMVLSLGIVGEDNIDNWNNLEMLGLKENAQGYMETINPNPDPKVIALAAYLNLIPDNPSFKDNPLISAIDEAFFGNSKGVSK
ncbi:MAG: hypothetical protein FWH35_03665 [Treponema sp.]|nr:hypothetical protein [Treponema sp.]